LLSALGGHIHPGQGVGLDAVAAQMLGLIQHVIGLLHQVVVSSAVASELIPTLKVWRKVRWLLNCSICTKA
jgi:hypothetical protein